MEILRNVKQKGIPSAGSSSFPRFAWECTLDALRPLIQGRIKGHYNEQGRRASWETFPRRAWEREVKESEINFLAWTLVAGEAAFIAGLFMLGGDFWDRLKQLFVWPGQEMEKVPVR